MPAGPILMQQLIAQQLAAAEAAKKAAPTPAMVPEGASQPNDFSGKSGLFGRLFPDRDPNTGAQGGILANPLFRLGLNLLQRSGPQARPHSLGQDIAGSVSDYSDQRDKEVGTQDAAIQGNIRRQGWNDLQGQVKFGDELGNPQDLMALINPSGNPDAIKVQGPGSDYKTRLAGLESGGDPNAQNKVSSASGKYQFIDSTRAWIDKANNFRSDDRSPETEEKRIDYFNKVNEQNLAMNGHEVNDANRYLSHLLGSKGANEFLWALKQMPDAQTKDRLGNEIVSKNANVFGGKTLQQAYDKITNSIAAGAWTDVQAPTQPVVAPTAQPQVAQQTGPAPMVAPTPQPPAQFPQGQASAPPTSLAPPQGGMPSSPPVGSAPGTPQAQAAPPVSAVPTGPTPQPTGDQTAQGPTIPAEILKPGPGGGLSKASMVEALGILPPPVRNAVILGAWMKAAGNKRLFAQELGTALLGMADDKSKAEALANAKGLKKPDYGTRWSTGDGSPDNPIVWWRENPTTGAAERDPDLAGVGAKSQVGVTNMDFTSPITASSLEATRRYEKKVPEFRGAAGAQQKAAFIAKMDEMNKAEGRKPYDEGSFARIQRARQQWTSGDLGKTVMATNTAANHAILLLDSIHKLNNGEFKTFNEVSNYLNDQFGWTGLSSWRQVAQRLSEEVTKSIVPGGGTGLERTMGQIDDNNSTDQAVTELTSLIKLIGGRLSGNKRMYDASLGPNDNFEDLLDPAVREILHAGQKESSTLPTEIKEKLDPKPKASNIKSITQVQ
jgi:hypothetical protein